MIQELKAQAYDILVQIDLHQLEINRLREQIIEINTQIQKISNEEIISDPCSNGDGSL